MSPIISIIIPVYNTYNYLEKCVCSILKQSLRDFEIIIIDDGSDIKTASLCDRLGEQDKRIKICHKENEGVSVARNIGISLASGDYIAFVDSDDWVDSSMYEELIKISKKENINIVFCDATTIEEGRKNCIDTFKTIPHSTVLEKKLITPNVLCEIAGSACRGIYKRDFILKYNIFFPVGLKLSEDRIFNLLALGHCKKLCYEKRPFYYRYIRRGSAVYSYHADAANTITEVHRHINYILNDLWDKRYQIDYQKQEINLFYGAINSVFWTKELNWYKRYKKIVELSKSNELANLLKKTHANDFRAKLIRQKSYGILTAITFFIHIKNKILKQ